MSSWSWGRGRRGPGPDAARCGEIAPEELARRLEEGRPVALLDIREADERARARIAPLAGTTDVHIPLPELEGRVAEVIVEPGRPLVVYCHHGVRSRTAAVWLAARGLGEVLNLEGGIDAWSREIDPRVPRY